MMQGIQATIEMSIGINQWNKPPKGGQLPLEQVNNEDSLMELQGIGNPKKAEAVKDLLRMEPTDILLLQETKIDEEALLFLSKTKWKKNANMVVSVRGTSGCLVTLWFEVKFILNASFVSQHWIYSEPQHTTSKITIALFNIYVPVNLVEKKGLLEFSVTFF